jgi:hypothetical protein
MTVDRRSLLVSATAWIVARPVAAAPVATVVLRTGLGDLEIEVDEGHAPVTAANFLRYVDGGHYDGGRFHRTVRLDNQPGQAVLIEVVQAGVSPAPGRRVVQGMDVVRRIQRSPADGQALTPPVPILSARRARPRP